MLVSSADSGILVIVRGIGCRLVPVTPLDSPVSFFDFLFNLELVSSLVVIRTIDLSKITSNWKGDKGREPVRDQGI